MFFDVSGDYQAVTEIKGLQIRKRKGSTDKC